MAKLLDQIEEQEQKEAKKEIKKVSSRINHDTMGKDKLISAKVNSSNYQKFSEICKMKGVSKNSKINELIADFVLQNESIL